jgi:hypothetical protein
VVVVSGVVAVVVVLVVVVVPGGAGGGSTGAGGGIGASGYAGEETIRLGGPSPTGETGASTLLGARAGARVFGRRWGGLRWRLP